MTKIILDDNSQPFEDNSNGNKIESSTKKQLVDDKDKEEKSSANFPDWDIVPPNQIINPRIK